MPVSPRYVRGIVVQDPSHDPVAQATVEFVWKGASASVPLIRATTDSEGSFSVLLPAVPPRRQYEGLGRLEVRVSLKGVVQDISEESRSVFPWDSVPGDIGLCVRAPEVCEVPDGVDEPSGQNPTVRGRIRHRDGTPVEGGGALSVHLTVWHVSFAETQFAPTGGAPNIEPTGGGVYVAEYVIPEGHTGPINLQVRVRVTEGGTTTDLVRSAVLYNAPTHARIDIDVDDERLQRIDEYNAILGVLTTTPKGVALGQLDGPKIDVLAGESGIARDRIAMLVAAENTVSELSLGSIPLVSNPDPGNPDHWGRAGEAIYGLFRQGWIQSVQGLLRGSRATIPGTLGRAADAGQISRKIANAADGFVDLVEGAAAAELLNDSVADSFGKLLGAAGIATEQRRKKLAAMWVGHAGTIPEFWSAVEGDADFDATDVANIRDCLRLNEVTQSHVSLVKSIRAQIGADPISKVAEWKESDWDARLDDTVDGQAVGVPSWVPGADAGEKRSNYIEILLDNAERKYPAVRFRARMADSGTSAFSTDTRQWIVDHPEKDITRDHFPYFAGAGTPDPVAIELRRGQRTYKVAPKRKRDEAVKALMSHGYFSASQIARKGKDAFAQDVASEIPAEAAKEIHAKAQIVSAAALQLYMQNHLANQGPLVNPDVLSSLTDEDTAAASNAIGDYEAIFGNTDFCACRDCRSILGPAAYLVDIIRFADEHGMWATISSRRPDIATLKLSCANTNTPLPHVDLLIEILENAVAGSGNEIAHDETNWTGPELLGRPEYSNAVAYDVLAGSWYPPSSPFDLGLEVQRAFLDHLGLDLADLHRLAGADVDADRAPDWARESLQSTSLAAAIVTGGATGGIWNGWDMDEVAAALFGYGSPTGEPPTPPTAMTMGQKQELASVPEFLRRTQLTLEDLLDLLHCRMANPLLTGTPHPTDPDDVVVKLENTEVCDLDAWILKKGETANEAPTGSRFSRLGLFLKLWRPTGWTMRELDAAMRAIGVGSASSITPVHVQELAAIRRLSGTLRLSFDELVALFGVLDTRVDRPGHEPEVRPIYDRLFFDRTTFPEADSSGWAFALNTWRDALEAGSPPALETQIANLAAALRTSSAEIATLLNALGSPTMSLASVSAVARGVLLCRALKLGAGELVRALVLAGLFDSDTLLPASALELEAWLVQFRILSKIGLNPVECAHILSDAPAGADDASLAALQPTDEAVDSVVGVGRGAAWSSLAALRSSLPVLEGLVGEMLEALDIPEFAPNAATLEYILEFLRGEWIGELNSGTDPSDDYVTDLIDTGGVFAAHVGVTPFTEYLIRRGASAPFDPPWLTSAADRLLWLLLELIRQHPADTVTPAYAVPAGVVALLESTRAAVRDALASALTRPGATLGTAAVRVPLALADASTPLPAGKLRDGATFFDVFVEPDVLFEAGTPSGSWLAPPPGHARNAVRWLERLLLLASRLGLDQNAIAAWRDFGVVPPALAVLDGWALPADPASPTPPGPDEWNALVALVAWVDAVRAVPFVASPEPPLGPAASNASAPVDDMAALAAVWASGTGREEYLAARTSWSFDDLTGALAQLDPVLDTAKTEGVAFARLTEVMGVARRTGASPAAFLAWPAQPDSLATADAVVAVARSRYDSPESWAAVARPLRDRIRDRQRRCLADWIIGHVSGVTDDDTIYGQYLIDPGMGPWLLTTRVKQAASSIQLFVQRAQLGLEGTLSAFGDEARRMWEWKKNYRVWEAARKVFLYPENWIEPELRDDKTPFFRALESALGQQSLSEANIEAAVRDYLRSLHDVHDLKILACLHDPESETLHVFGRGWNEPSSYWHRCQSLGVWSAWEKLDVGIQSDQLLPLIVRGNLTLFWLDLSDVPTAGSAEDEQDVSVRVVWTRRTGGVWSGRTSQSDPIRLAEVPPEVFAVLPGDETRAALRLVGEVVGGLVIVRLVLPAVDLGSNGNQYPSWGQPRSLVAVLTLDPCTDQLVPSYGEDGFFLQRTIVPWTWSGQADLGPINSDGPALTVVAHRGSPESHLPSTWDTTSGETDLWGMATFAPWLPFLRTVFPRSAPAWNGWDPFFVQSSAGSVVVSRIGDPDTEGAETPPPDGDHPLPNFRFDIFGHPFICEFIEATASGGVEGLLSPAEAGVAGAGSLARQARSGDVDEFDNTFHPTTNVVEDFPLRDVDFRLSGPYSPYNWEVFFHLPLLVASRLNRQQRFESALRWLRFIFDPMSRNTAYGVPERYWKVRPLMEPVGAPVTDWIAFTGVDGSADYEAFARSVQAWSADPFNPYAVARLRPGAFQKTVFMRFVDVLIGWGDQLFRRETIESLQEATQYYVLASQLLGPRPRRLPEQGDVPALSYAELDAQDVFIDAFSNPIVQIENTLPDAPDSSSEGYPAPLAGYGDLAAYFCVPPNAKLLGYWDTVADRLWKIRNGLDIAGVRRDLPLYEPPIDPALLVRARAMGLDLGSVLNDAAVSRPPYRFNVTLGKAQGLVGSVRALGAALLGSLEKRDAEEIAQIRARHELELLRRTRDVRVDQVRDAKFAVQALRVSRSAAETRLSHVQRLIDGEEGEPGKIKEEIEREDHTKTALDLSLVAQGFSTAAGLLSLIPQIHSPASVEFGGVQISTAVRGVADVLSIIASAERGQADRLAVSADQRRRLLEWQQQEKQTKKEIDGLEKQILGAEIRLAIAEKELANHAVQVDQSREVEEWLRTKYTNRDLYDWMVGETADLYFSAYQLAYDLAKKAQHCFEYELGIEDAQVVRFGHWDDLHRGLMAGERLAAQLEQLETGYLNRDVREHEMTKHISLAQLGPQALTDLIELGECDFTIGEAAFDLDVPGHYFRRIQSVSLSINAVGGRQGTVNAKLTLNSAALRRSVGGAFTPVSDPAASTLDPGVEAETGINESIIVSGPQDDAGVFQLNLQDPRYLPFERRGAISNWSLALTALAAQLDRSAISDVVLHVRFTARYDEAHATAVQTYFATGSNNSQTFQALVALGRDYPDAFHELVSEGSTFSIAIPDLLGRLPYSHRLPGAAPTVTNVEIAVRSTISLVGKKVGVGFGATSDVTLDAVADAPQWYFKARGAQSQSLASNPSLPLAAGGSPAWTPDPDETLEVLVLLTYTANVPA